MAETAFREVYPKLKYRFAKDHPHQYEYVRVEDAAAEAALQGDWFDTPRDAIAHAKTQPAPVAAGGETLAEKIARLQAELAATQAAAQSPEANAALSAQGTAEAAALKAAAPDPVRNDPAAEEDEPRSGRRRNRG